MKAIIMAGGEGTRLRPLTCDCPKPMMRLMNRPVIEYTVGLLRAHGITEIAATLGYQPDAVTDRLGDGSGLGVSLRWYIEETPLGTAGGVGRARDFLDETFVVMSGDGVTDLDLSAAVRFHRKKRAQATLVLRREPAPSEYGVVSVDPEGRVCGFREKPCRSDAVSDTINTGVYILEPGLLDRIPTDRPFDFGHDLFPQLLRDGGRMFGWIMDGYWCDVGDVRAYLDVHRAALDGCIRLDSLAPPGGVSVSPDASVDPSAVLEAPCRIGRRVRIGPNARIGAYTVLGDDCTIGEGADLKRAVLWPEARVEPFAQLRDCVLAGGACAGRASQIYEECALGTGAATGERTVLSPGVKLWPGKFAPDGERLDANLVWGNRRGSAFAHGMLALETPARTAGAAQAVCAAIRPGELLLGRGPSSVASALWHAAASGAMSLGVQVLDAGVCTLPQLRHAQRALRTDAAALITAESMIPLSANGALLTAQLQRAVNTLNARHDYSGPFTGVTRPMAAAGRTDVSYVADTAACFCADPKSIPPLAVHAQSPHLLSLAERCFARAGLTVRTGWEDELRIPSPGEIGISLNEQGERAVLSDASGPLDEAEQQLMLAWTAMELGERELLLPVSATRAVTELAAGFHARAVYVAGDRSVWMNALAEHSPKQFRLWFDGLYAALLALSMLSKNALTPADWRRRMPKVHRSSRTVEIPVSESGRILNAFAQQEPGAELGGGVRFLREEGWAWLCPDEQRPEFRIVTEAMRAETARELCDFCEEELKRLAAAPPR